TADAVPASANPAASKYAHFRFIMSLVPLTSNDSSIGLWFHFPSGQSAAPASARFTLIIAPGSSATTRAGERGQAHASRASCSRGDLILVPPQAGGDPIERHAGGNGDHRGSKL